MTTNASKTQSIQGSKSGASWWWAAGVVLLGLPLIYWSQASAEPEEFAERREQIRNMSPTQREQLNRNYERFQALSLEKQQSLRAIDEKVSGNNEELKSTLKNYERWLNTLTPWQRRELRNAATSSDRLQIVAAINTDRKARIDEYEQDQQDFQKLLETKLSESQGRKPGESRYSDRAMLSDYDLNAMVSVLKDKFDSKVKLRPNHLPGSAARNFQLLAVALEEHRETVEPESAREQPLPEETIQAMIDAISDSEVREDWEKLHQDWGPKGFVGHLSRKLDMAWWSEARRQYPSQSELDKIAKDYGGKALEEFERQRKKDPRGAYLRLWFVTRWANFTLDRRELDDEMNALGLRRPSGFRPGSQGSRRRGSSSRKGDGFSGPPFPPPNGRPDGWRRPAIAQKPKSSE